MNSDSTSLLTSLTGIGGVPLARRDTNTCTTLRRVQRRLVRSALLEFPESPNRTNHTKEHGLLTNLWDAARRDLSLAQQVGTCPVTVAPPAKRET